MSYPYADNIVKSTPQDMTRLITSRYLKSNIIIDEAGDEYLETYENAEFPENSSDMYHLVTPQEENRLDLISHQYYGNPLQYWVIAEANNIVDPMIVPIGIVLRIPSRESIMEYRSED